MKKRIMEIGFLLALIAVVTTTYQQQAGPLDRLAGRWETSSQEMVAYLEFGADGVLSLQVGEETKSARYTIEGGPDVYQLDVLMDDEEPVLTIAKFVDDNTLVIRDTNPGQPRPENFDKRTMTFTRID